MSKPVFLNSKVVYHDNSREYHIDARGKDLASVMRAIEAEDVTPSEDSSNYSDCQSDITSVQEEKPADIIDSIIFTKKAKREAKIPTILDALKKSVERRRDKTRAFVEELQEWQEEGYVDAHYNAKVMYDELEKFTPLTFGYETFKKYYNNTI